MGTVRPLLGAGIASVLYRSESSASSFAWMHSVEDRVGSLLGSLADRSRSRGESVAARVIRDLPVRPIVNADTVAKRYGMSRQAAHEALARLGEDGVLTERSVSRRTNSGGPRQMFTSTELIELLSEIITN
jgi:hypothetical protein